MGLDMTRGRQTSEGPAGLTQRKQPSVDMVGAAGKSAYLRGETRQWHSGDTVYLARHHLAKRRKPLRTLPGGADNRNDSQRVQVAPRMQGTGAQYTSRPALQRAKPSRSSSSGESLHHLLVLCLTIRTSTSQRADLWPWPFMTSQECL
jgi:hypothetical protein